MHGYGDVGPQRKELSAVKWFKEAIPEHMVSELSVQGGYSETEGFNWCQISLENCDVPGIASQAILKKAQRSLYSWSKIDFVSQVTERNLEFEQED